jgi:acyl-coenzyme A synthetase/AMP-(fatty) acid ligase
MLFDVRRQITYRELDSWIENIRESLLPFAGKRVLISLPVGSEALACYLASWNMVAAITYKPVTEDAATELIKHWDCSAALVSFDPGAQSKAILPGVWLWQPNTPSTTGYVPGIGMLTSGTTGAAKLVMIPHDQHMQHWSTGFHCNMIPAWNETTWLGMPLWTDWGFVNAWTVYQTRSQCIIEQFRPGREVLHRALQESDIVHYGSALFKLSKVQPVNHGRIYVSGPNLSHREKMKQAEILGIPVLNHYGSTEAGCISTQTMESWTRPGSGIPCMPYEIRDDVLWVQRMDDHEWWCMHDLVRQEDDGQLSILGRSGDRVRTASGMVDLVAARDHLFQEHIIDDGEFIVDNSAGNTRIIFVHCGKDDEPIKQALKKFNNGCNFVDKFVKDQQIQRNEIGKIMRQMYVN